MTVPGGGIAARRWGEGRAEAGGRRLRPGPVLSVLRLAGLGLRFALSLYVLAALGAVAFGQFALIQALAILAPALVSLGLHHRVNRTVVDASPVAMAACLRDRMAMTLLVGMAAIGAAVPVWAQLSGAVGGGRIAGLALAVLLVEVVLADAQVLLINCRRAVLAGGMLFLRVAGWVPAYVALSHLQGWTGLEPLLWCWLGGGLAALAVMAAGLAGWPWGRVLREAPRLRGQFEGFHMSLRLWLGDVGMAAAPFLERAVLLLLLEPVEAGAYIFLWTLANGIQQVLMAGLVQPAVPDMVAAARKAEGVAALRRLVLERARRVVLAGAGAGLAVLAGAGLALPLLDRPEVAAVLPLLPLLVAGLVAACLADLLRLALYARGLDGAIIRSNLVMVGMNTGLVALMAALTGPLGVAVVPLAVAVLVMALRWRAAFGFGTAA